MATERYRLRRVWTPGGSLAVAGVVVVMVLFLRALGREVWCEGGGLSPWSWDIWSTHNSQHLIDPYSFTHMQHGLLAFAILWLLLRGRWPVLGLLVAVVAEAAWEVFENTDFVIESYRESTMALNYYGDSILNSVADVVAFAAGYSMAGLMAGRVAAAVFFVTEAVLFVTIRDSLILNVLMLLYPVEAIKTWQMGG